MYKFKSYMMAMLAVGSMALLSSCGNDDNEKPAPTLVLSGPDAAGGDVEAGDPISITITATNNGASNIDRFEVRYSQQGGQALTLPDETQTGLNAPNFNHTFTASAANAGTETYTFIVTNKDGRSATQTVTFNITDPNQGQPIATYSAILMGGQNNATYGSFLDANDGIVYKQQQAAQNQADIDLVYFFGSANQATLAAPSDGSFGTATNQIDLGIPNWTTKNATELKKLPGGQGTYNNASTPAALETAFTSATASADSRANQLSSGDIVAFRTQGGKYGLVRVGAVSGGNTGTINIEVKVQQ